MVVSRPIIRLVLRCAMTLKYLLRLFFLPGLLSLGVHSAGEGPTNVSLYLDGGCSAEITVLGGKEVVKRYSEGEREKISKNVEQVRLYCKPNDGFQGIQVQFLGRVYSDHTLDFTAEELGISPVSRWHDVNVTFYYRYNSALWHWYIKVSVSDGREEEKFVKKGTSFSKLTTMTIYSLGPSKWRFSRPDDRCFNQSGQNTTSTDESKSQTQTSLILVIVLGVALAITISITIAVACKRKFTETCVLPRVKEEDEEALHYEVRYTNGRNTPVTRPGSAHDSENSLYGVV